eukprot:Opistho-2@17887
MPVAPGVQQPLPPGHRHYSTPREIEEFVVSFATIKAKLPWHKVMVNGILAGAFVGLSGMLSATAAGGFTAEFRALYPAVPKLLGGAVFPLGLVLILLYGGELFTGNTMYFLVGLMHRKVSFRDIARNWFIVYFANLAGCLTVAYFFSYLTGYFEAEPYLSYVVKLSESKCSHDFGNTLLRAIPANWLVCLAITTSLAAQDVGGKAVAMWYPIFGFATIGFEHCVASMFVIPNGMLYGANVTAGEFIVKNLIPATIGNLIGGGFLCGVTLVYLYHWFLSAPAPTADGKKEPPLKPSTPANAPNGGLHRNSSSTKIEMTDLHMTPSSPRTLMAAQKGTPAANYVKRYRTKEGASLPVSISVYLTSSDAAKGGASVGRQVVAYVERLMSQQEASVSSGDANHFGFLIVDHDGSRPLEEGRIVFADDAVCAMLGYSRDELCHMTIDSITHPGDSDVSGKYLREMFQANQSDGKTPAAWEIRGRRESTMPILHAEV